jgi:nucleotide-binding universal stress UspA family protein
MEETMTKTMTKTVLAVIEGGHGTAAVLSAAKALAVNAGASPRALHVLGGDDPGAEEAARLAAVPLEVLDGDPLECIVTAASLPAVAAAVVGTHLALGIATRLDRPLLAVPAAWRLIDGGCFHRVLIPLEGTPAGTGAISDAASDLLGAGVVMVAAHVFAPATAPRFWDQPGHAGMTWGAEFLSRWCDQPDVDLHLRTGDVPGALLDVARCERADLITLGWSRNLGEGRAAVVRSVVSQSDVPVLLVPVRPSAGGTDASRGSAAR